MRVLLIVGIVILAIVLALVVAAFYEHVWVPYRATRISEHDYASPSGQPAELSQ